MRLCPSRLCKFSHVLIIKKTYKSHFQFNQNCLDSECSLERVILKFVTDLITPCWFIVINLVFPKATKVILLIATGNISFLLLT